MVYLPEANVAADALIKGEVDILEAPAPDLQGMLHRSPDVTVRSNNPLGGGLFLVITIGTRRSIASKRARPCCGQFGNPTTCVRRLASSIHGGMFRRVWLRDANRVSRGHRTIRRARSGQGKGSAYRIRL